MEIIKCHPGKLSVKVERDTEDSVTGIVESRCNGCEYPWGDDVLVYNGEMKVFIRVVNEIDADRPDCTDEEICGCLPEDDSLFENLDIDWLPR